MSGVDDAIASEQALASELAQRIRGSSSFEDFIHKVGGVVALYGPKIAAAAVQLALAAEGIKL